MKKGLELPMNIVILLVIAIIVLIAIMALLYSTYPTAKGSVDLSTAKNSACQFLINMGCLPSTGTVLVNDFDANMDGNIQTGSENFGSSDTISCDKNGGDNLARLCACYYGVTTNLQCRMKICGCSS
jgi:hypothetical protein